MAGKWTIQDIPTITSWEIARLGKLTLRISKVGTLVALASKLEGRKWLSKVTGITEERITQLAHYADLMLVPGVGAKNAKLIIDAGVKNVFDLKQRNCDNLCQALAGTIHPTYVGKMIQKARERHSPLEW